MDIKLKHRLVGACVILALAVFFLPMILDSEKYNKEIESQIPEQSALKEQSDNNNSSEDSTADSGSLTINLDEDEPEKAITKPASDVNKPESERTNGDSEAREASNTRSESSENVNNKTNKPLKSEASSADSDKDSATTNKSEETKTSVNEDKSDSETSSQNTVSQKSKPQPSQPQKSDAEPQDAKPTESEKPKEQEVTTPKPQFEENSWVIQIGSFSNKENATQLVSDLRTKGYRAYSREAGEYLRVYVGPYPDKSAADSRTEGLEKVVGAAVKVIEFDPQAH